ncbi:MAG: DUF4845 domain-containing protein [Gammaproteobacteria bacterium]
MKFRDKQRGMSAVGWLLVLGLIGFFSLIGLRLAPMYLEYFNVVSSMESLKSESEIKSKAPAEIMQMLMKRFDVNDVRNVKPNHVRVTNEGGKLKVIVKYEVRTPLMGNLSAVATFDKNVELR